FISKQQRFNNPHTPLLQLFPTDEEYRSSAEKRTNIAPKIIMWAQNNPTSHTLSPQPCRTQKPSANLTF
ncbi:MAG: hypothetical protein RI601_11730, partial [Desulfurivibrionaceae bacterium]|nr:hypothetical protein [Desulfurivibrionaceae bacterium]